MKNLQKWIFLIVSMAVWIICYLRFPFPLDAVLAALVLGIFAAVVASGLFRFKIMIGQPFAFLLLMAGTATASNFLDRPAPANTSAGGIVFVCIASIILVAYLISSEMLMLIGRKRE